MNDLNKLKQEFIDKCGYEPSQEELMKYLNDKNSLENGVKHKEKKIAYGWLFVVWFICSFVALFMLSGTEREIESTLIFGHYFLVFCLMFILSSRGVKNLSWLFILAIAFIVLLVFYPGGINIDINPDNFSIIVMGFIFAGVGVFAFFLITGQLGDKPEYQDVQGIVSGYIKGRKGAVTCIYEYEYNGIKYNNRDNYSTNIIVPKLGTIVHLRVNPNDPNIFVAKKEKTFQTYLFPAIFILLGIGMIILGFMNK